MTSPAEATTPKNRGLSVSIVLTTTLMEMQNMPPDRPRTYPTRVPTGCYGVRGATWGPPPPWTDERPLPEVDVLDDDYDHRRPAAELGRAVPPSTEETAQEPTPLKSILRLPPGAQVDDGCSPAATTPHTDDGAAHTAIPVEDHVGHTPQVGTPQVGTPQVGTPQVGTPKRAEDAEWSPTSAPSQSASGSSVTTDGSVSVSGSSASSNAGSVNADGAAPKEP